MDALQVAILVETSSGGGRGIIEGIAAYAKVHGPILFHLVTGHLIQKLPPQSEWDGDGIIARIQTPELARQLRKRNLPTIRVSGRHYPEWHYVGTRNASLGERAAEHFLERGFRRFGYIGVKNELWSDQREEAFKSQIGRMGYPCSSYHDDENHSVSKRRDKIGQWIDSLEKPAAIMACDDPHGRVVIEACHQRNVPVPELVSVCGVDNDEIICNMCTPSLSSVPLNTFRIGYLAAQALHQMIRGESVEDITSIEPLPVVVRQSSDLIAIEDPIVADAIKLIRERAHEGLTVKLLLKQLSCSRRTLEMRFQKALQRSPHEEIRRIQIDRARKLLLETDLKIEEIARMSGFSRAAYLNDVFRKKFDDTPAGYRRASATALFGTP